MKLLIVDDSRLARKELQNLLSRHSDLYVVAEATDVKTAVAAINEHQPDIVLLDIHLPDGDGFDVLEQADYTPQVIFTTAYEQHALRAFELNALDYLLKPVTQERFDLALERRAFKSLDPVPTTAIAISKPLPKTRTDQVFVRDGERCHFIKLSNIYLISVEGNYVRLYFQQSKALLAKSLNYIEERLDPSVFFRANRQQIINMDYVDKIEPWVNEGLIVTLHNGESVEVSRRQAKAFKHNLEL